MANCKKIGIETPCPLHWKQLEVTKEKNVKYCNICEDKVYFCESDEELIKNAIKGNCIAFAQVDESEFPHIVFGKPTTPISISNREQEALNLRNLEREKIRPLKDAKYSDRSCDKCEFPIASFRKECWVCRK